MKKNPFLAKLEEKPIQKATRNPALEILEEFCSSIKPFTHDQVDCKIFPGYLTNLGQEYRITLTPTKGKANDFVLFRAHVPGKGFPVNLDFYDDELVVCNDENRLNDELMKFLDRENTRDVIGTLSTASVNSK